MNKSAAQILRAVHPFARFRSTLHGPAHWARVHRFAKALLKREQVPVEAETCVLLFAWHPSGDWRAAFGGSARNGTRCHSISFGWDGRA
jgi:hypothetical protein